MNLVLDANILFAALIRDNVTRELIVSEYITLFAPEFIFSEIEKHFKDICERSGKTALDVRQILFALSQIIVFIPDKELTMYISYAKKISPDPNDSVYFALALKLTCPIWSNDKKLKEQKEIIVYNTEEIMRTFRNEL
jgi:predicted nucleic acid-binding protein